MNVFVINLSSAIERRQFQEEQLLSLALDHQILSATSTDDINDETYKRHYFDWQRPLKNTEVACYYSHRSAWNKVIKTDRPVLILEDDALLSQCVPKLLKLFSDKKDVDLINLEVRGRKKFVSKIGEDIMCNSKLFRLYQDRTGAAGYILWPSGAKKLIQYEEENGIALADAHIANCTALVAYQVEPAAITQLDQCDDYGIFNTCSKQIQVSTVSEPNNPKGEAIFWVKRIIAQIMLGFRQLGLIRISQRRYIKIRKKDFLWQKEH